MKFFFKSMNVCFKRGATKAVSNGVKGLILSKQ